VEITTINIAKLCVFTHAILGETSTSYASFCLAHGSTAAHFDEAELTPCAPPL